MNHPKRRQRIPVVLGDPVSLTAEVRAVGLAGGLDDIGVASAQPFVSTRRDLEERKAAGLHGGMAFTYRNPARSTDPARVVQGAASVVVGARSYRRPEVAVSGDRPQARVARYAWTDSYAPLRVALAGVAACLRAAGYRARVVVDDNALVDREAAVRAGLGWYGKNANVLLPGRGSWFVLGSVVTDAPLISADEHVEGECGTCTCCLRGCPTGAITAPGVVDARRCLAWLVQAPGVFPRTYRRALGDRLYGCDDCQDVCPLNRPAAGALSPRTDQDVGRPYVDILELLALDDAGLLAAAGSWYVAERDARYLRRNALIVLANTGDASDHAVLAAVCAALAHPDALVRAHAVWAAARLGRPELADSLAKVEDDPTVLSELRTRAAVAAGSDSDSG